MKRMVLAVISIFFSIGISNAQPYKVILNPYYGDPGESQFLVEDNAVMVRSGKNVMTIVSSHYPAGVIRKEPRFDLIEPIWVPSTWNPLLLRKQINNIDKRIIELSTDQSKTTTERDILVNRLRTHQTSLRSILSTVEAEIAHSPMVNK